MFNINKSKAINSLLFVIHELGVDKSDCHKVFKILYFADQKHLIRYGRPITGDVYMKMKYGPVPSYIRDVTESKQHEGLIQRKNSHFIESSYPVEMDDLSDSDIECLKESIEENRNISFNELTNKSHDKAWDNADWQMNYMDIAKAATDDRNMLEYIRTNALNESISFSI
ncbi:Panacea domain-containing protein [Tannerella forsythia]|uniref:Panacea domain-containing protein n=1 Tax=Tannerella forsythia TaxID=28112 RepID=UPI000618C6F0|nr:Panacea domain-containing protein [Tannerella forsythia]BAR48153.1 hypothetical protein TF3313_0574 [Tannerella forsythia 3313]